MYLTTTQMSGSMCLLCSCCIAEHFCCYWGEIRVRLVVWLGLRGKGRVNSVIIDVIAKINYNCNYAGI